MFSWEYSNSTNILLLDESGSALASNSPDHIVVLRELTLRNLRESFAAFKTELYAALYEALGQTPSEFANWHGGTKYSFGTDICSPQSCVAFKRYSEGSNKLAWLSQPPIVTALIDMNVIPAVTPHGKARKNMIRGGGGVVEVAQGLSTKIQRKLLHTVMYDYNYDLDEIFKILGQSNVFALRELEAALSSAASADDALTSISELFSSFAIEQKAQYQATGNKKGDGRHFAAPWFVAYLAREGVLLWPTKAASDSEFVFPRVLKPMMWTFLVPEHGRKLAHSLVGPDTDEKLHPYIQPVYRDLLWTTTFFERPSFSSNHLLQLKSRYHSPPHNSEARGYGANLIFNSVLAYHNLTYEDVGSIADYFGGRRRIASAHGRDAFSWVDHPKQHNLRRYQKIFSSAPPDRFPEYVVQWAADLRTLLSTMGVRAVESKVDDLNIWLLYLISVGADYAPKTWQEINREKHINSVDTPGYSTFVDFVRKLGGARAQSYITTLRQAWTIAATRDGFSGKISCPIDPEIDSIKKYDNKNNTGRTRRKALDEHVLELLIQENRRADKKGKSFAFARSLNRYERDVVDSVDGKQKKVFWPALPIMLDIILTTGMRKISAQWMDSAEGDEVWVDAGQVKNLPNHLPSATKEREMGFLRLISISNEEQVLGMFLPINKGDPYEVPWVDEKTAKLYNEMRDWQVRYNGRKKPILATREFLRKDYSDETEIPEVYPVFRDPKSRQGYPPSDGTLYTYWKDLVAHCEKILNNNRRKAAKSAGKPFKPEALLRADGKPRWDIHSLRVTTVSTLIDAGVSPHIVALLVGHKSVAMTWHYVEVNNQKTYERIKQGLEERRRRAIARMEELKTEADVDNALDTIFGGIVTLRGDEATGAELLKDALLSRAPGSYEVFAHGICPGGDCSTGGINYKNAYLPVFRPRACSRCRHRVTGPAFLNGLVHRLNALMIEITDSYEREADLNIEIESAEDAGRSSVILEGLVRRERELRDEVWAEWAAELTTVRRCNILLDQKDDGENLPMLTGMDLTQVQTKFEAVHQLSLLQQVVSEADMITGATIEIPAGARAKRDEMLLEIARQNNASRFFYTLEPKTRKRALDAFGSLLTHHASQMGDLAPDHIDALLQGAETMPWLNKAVEQICQGVANEQKPVAEALGS